MRWFRRNGRRVAESRVRASKDAYALGKRCGILDGLRCSVQENVADRIDRMTLPEFASWSGQFTWRNP